VFEGIVREVYEITDGCRRARHSAREVRGEGSQRDDGNLLGCSRQIEFDSDP
jgi:hypothetical protein